MKNKKGTFTLLELLMVIGVIGILAAILLPALLNARRKAKLISCVNNQKQIGTGFHLYAGDFDEFAYTGPEWAVAMMPESIVKPYRDAGKLAWVNAPKGQGYLKGEAILFCPEEQVSNLGGAASYGKALSCAIGSEAPFKFTTTGTVKNLDQTSTVLPVSFKRYITPSNSILGADCGIISTDSGDEYVHYSGIDNTNPCITLRHKNIANVFFADGHVKSLGRELKDCYLYNVRGSSHKDEKFTMAIKDKQKYELTD